MSCACVLEHDFVTDGQCLICRAETGDADPHETSATEHRCKTGGWKPGPASQCEVCKAKAPYRSGQFIRVRQ